jgi:ketosteroid isomerase-like protein
METEMSNSIDSFLSTWANAERTGNAGTLEALLTPDFYGVGPLGFILPKPAWLARHRSGEFGYDRFDLDEIQTHAYDGVALVTVRNNTRGAYQGHPIPEAVRATLVLVNEAEGWRLAAIHMSFIAGTAGAPPIPGG